MHWFITISLLCTVVNANHFLGGFRRGLRIPHRTVQAETCSAADQQVTRMCLDSYFAGLSVDSSQTLPDYFQYLAKIDLILANYGLSGYDIFCNYEVGLESCLGALFSTPCMDPPAFEAMYNINEMEATEYATSFKIEQYTCQNKQVLKDNFVCLRDTTESGKDEIVECSVKMAEEFPDATDICVPISEDIGCLDNIYKACGKDVQNFMCTSQLIAYQYDLGDECTGELPDCSAL